MANNVRFYKLISLPTFDANIHTGIFVHLTTAYNDGTTNRPEGLWFGGRVGWEYLTNASDTSSITNIVTAAIENLDANTVATLVAAPSSSGSGTTLTLKGVKENDGIISQGDGTSTVTIGAGKLQIGVGNANNPSDLFGANDTGNTVLVLDDTQLNYNTSTHTLGVITNSNTSASNKIATMADIASISGAMHYKGTLNSSSDLPSTTAPGDVYIVETAFTDAISGITYEVGDMVVYGNAGAMNIIQSNMTIGTHSGQVATNDGDLTSGNIVIATGNGISTSSSYSLSGASSRTLTITDDTPAGQTPADGVNHSTSIVDSLTIFGQNRGIRLVIGSINPSIEVKEGGSSDQTVNIDLVWNTSVPTATGN